MVFIAPSDSHVEWFKFPPPGSSVTHLVPGITCASIPKWQAKTLPSSRQGLPPTQRVEQPGEHLLFPFHPRVTVADLWV